MKECRYCLAETKQGKLCKRLAACKIGCRYFCFQHAKMFGGVYTPRKSCKEKLLQCKPCSSPKRKFPCTKRHTVFVKDEDFDEWCDMIKSRRKAGKVHKAYKKYSKVPMRRKSSTKKVRFNLK